MNIVNSLYKKTNNPPFYKKSVCGHTYIVLKHFEMWLKNHKILNYNNIV